MKFALTVAVVGGTMLLIYFYPKITLGVVAFLAMGYYIMAKVVIWDIGRDHLRPKPRNSEERNE